MTDFSKHEGRCHTFDEFCQPCVTATIQERDEAKRKLESMTEKYDALVKLRGDDAGHLQKAQAEIQRLQAEVNQRIAGNKSLSAELVESCKERNDAILQKRELEDAVLKLSVEYQRQRLPLPADMIEAWANVNKALTCRPGAILLEKRCGMTKPMGNGETCKAVFGHLDPCDYAEKQKCPRCGTGEVKAGEPACARCLEAVMLERES